MVQRYPLQRIEGKGIYTLIIEVFREIEVEVGRLGCKRYPAGLYTYTGSALGPSKNSLFNRLSRHLRVKKRIFWHIDHLLKSGFVKVKAIVYSQTDEPYECLVNRILMGRSIKLPHLEGFGASDCMKGCRTHLLYFGTLNDVVTFVHDAYRSIGLDPKVISHEEFHIFKSEVDRSSI